MLKSAWKLTCADFTKKNQRVLHCNAKGGVVQNILAKKKETLQMVVTSSEHFPKKEKSFEKFW